MTEILCGLGLCVLAGALFVGGFAAGIGASDDDWRALAVKRGHAEWVVVDPAKGTTEFRWKEQP